MEVNGGKDDRNAASRLPPKQAVDRPPVPQQPVGIDDRHGSPLVALQLISEEAVRALHNVYSGGGSDDEESSPLWVGHQVSPMEPVGRLHRRSNSLQNLKSHFQKAMRWGGSSQEDNRHPDFDPEELANQKRQWYQLQAKSPDLTNFTEPLVLYEHFIVTGLRPDANLASVEEAFSMKKKLEMEMLRSKTADRKALQEQVPSPPSLEPQILFKYPPGKKLPMRASILCSFCFPGGVQAGLVERTPSLSDLNELVFGREHLGSDTSAFIFSLKGADNATLYGVCVLVPEIVQRSPSILGGSSPVHHKHATSRFLVSAPRCYCLLTRIPFFELHYEMLNSIVAQERLNRITQFVSEVSVTDNAPLSWQTQGHDNAVGDFPNKDSSPPWMSSAIPLDSTVSLAAAAAGIIPDDEVGYPSNRMRETQSRSDGAASKDSTSPERENDKDVKSSQNIGNHGSGEQHTSFRRPYENSDCDRLSSEPSVSSHCNSPKLWRSSSFVSLLRTFSAARRLEDEEDAYSSSYESGFSSGFSCTEWAKTNMNDFLKILRGYGNLPIPARGTEIIFQPLDHLQAIQYRRPAVSDLGLGEELPELESEDPLKLAEVNAKLAAAEDAFALSEWTTATICRVLCLDNVLAVVTGVLLEKQVALTCPNLGVLSAAVLSLVPMIRPFEWQSLLLPVLPEKMLDFLEAPVPFLVGLEKKPTGLKIKTSDLVHVDVFKDQLKTCPLPLLPRCKELAAELRPIHARLACQSSMAERHPVYRCTEEQAEAGTQFLKIMRRYMESLCGDIRSNTITSVESNNDRVSILLKDSFVDSFPSRDRPFVKLFVETQMFSVLSDSRLSRYEHENL